MPSHQTSAHTRRARYTYAILSAELRDDQAPARTLKAPPLGAVIRDRRTKKIYLASDLRTNAREVTFNGQLAHEDAQGLRLYPARPRRLTPARTEILERGPKI